MNQSTLVIPLALAFALILFWLLRPHRRQSVTQGRLPIEGNLDSALPRHYRFFPQIRQAISLTDNRYLQEVSPPEIARQVLRERRDIARRFLRGLREDFSSLERLARMVASLSPELDRRQETERLMLGLQFRILYALVYLRLSTGRLPVQQIEHLTELIGRLALRMEQAMAEVSLLSADRTPRGISA